MPHSSGAQVFAAILLVRLEQSAQLEPQVKTSVLRKPADAKREAASIAFL